MNLGIIISSGDCGGLKIIVLKGQQIWKYIDIKLFLKSNGYIGLYNFAAILSGS
jgi:hypothetical protein